MAAPTGLSSGAAPEPVTPESAAAPPGDAAEPQDQLANSPKPVAEPAPVPAPAQPVAGENAVADPEPGLDPDPELGLEPDPELDADLDPELDPELGPEPDQRRTRRPGRMVAAIAVIVVLAAAAAVAALAVVTHGFRPKTVLSYQPAAVFGLRAGQCIDSSPNGLAVTVLSCTSPHQAEVFATVSLTGSSWPGSAAVQQQAASACQDRVASYLNPALLNAGLTQEYVYPDQSAWQAGMRTAVCEVSSSSGPLTGSVRSTG